MEELKKLRKEKLNNLNIPLILSINNTNIEKYFDAISNSLSEENFKYVKKVDDGMWSHFIFDVKDTNISFAGLKKKLRTKYPTIEFQENLSYLEWLEDTHFKVTPHFENKVVFEHFELWVQYEKV